MVKFETCIARLRHQLPSAWWAFMLLCLGLLSGASVAQEQSYVLEAQGGNSSLSAMAGQRLQLSVLKKLGDQGIAGEQVDWAITGGDGARLSSSSSRTTKASADVPAGLASTVFSSNGAGSFQVTASSRVQPGCTADDCARISFSFNISVSVAESRSGSDASGKWIGAAAGALAIAVAAGGKGNGEESTPPDQTSRGLAIISGDGQSGFANSSLSSPLVVRALDNGAPASGVGINWTASGGATLSGASSGTGSNGEASITVTNLGAGPGPVTVTARRADSSTAIVSFTLNVVVPTLDRVSGHNQTVFTSSTAAPLIVEARLSGAPQSGLGINWSVISGNATIASISNGGVTNSLGQSSATVLVGATAGTIQIRAARSDRPSITQTFTINATQARTLSIVSGDEQSGLTNNAVENPLVVQARTNGLADDDVDINWSVTSGDAVLSASTSITNAGGNASIGVTFGSNPGTVIITATRADDSSASVSFELTSILVRTLNIVSGNNQSGVVDGALASPLVVRAENNGIPAAGVTILWDPSGTATLSSFSSVTDASGLASVMVTSLGRNDPVTVTAARADDTDVEVNFSLDILPSVLSIISGNNQNGLIGSPADLPLVVRLLDGQGAAVAGQGIAWTVIGGSASLSAFSSTTDANGQASINFTFGTSTSPITIRASAYSGTVTVNFSADPDNSSGLIKIGGDGQTAAAGVTLPIPLAVRLNEGGGLRPSSGGGQVSDPAALSGVPITFTVLSGTAQILSTSGPTDANGEASAVVKLGLTPGPVTVRAAIPGGPNTTFNLTVSGSLVAGALTIISGNNQTLTLGVASTPMVVELRANGSPLVGATVNWSRSNGTLSNSSSTTDSNGRASTTVTPAASGELTVTATFPAFNEFTGASIVFTHNTTIASIPNLPTDSVAVAVALDSACSDLQGGSGLSPAQQDLLNQCLALGAAAAANPEAVAEAIEEMLPDSAQAQTQSSQAASNAQFENLTGRMTSLRAGVQGASFNGLSLQGLGGRVPLAGLASALSADDGNDSAAETFGRWGFFMTGTIGRGEADPGSATPGFDFDVNGITAGVDYRKSDNLVLGVALGYTKQDTTLAGGQGAVDMSGFSFSAYSTWYQDSSWYMDSVLTLARNSYDSTRLISFILPPSFTVNQLAVASSDGSDLNASVTFGRDFNKGSLNYGVYGRAMYGRQSYDGYTEQVDNSLPGAGLALRVAARDVTSISSVLGAKISASHSTNWGVFVPQFEIEWQKEYRSDADAFQAFFVNDPSGTPIIITGEALDDSFFRAGAGFSAVFTNGRSGFLMYEHIFGRDRISQYSLALGFRVEF